jgi:predicted enzyme related to lactoylglutathione lyase
LNDKFKKHGAFSWFELMTPNFEATRKFYTEIFGWSWGEIDNIKIPYTNIKVYGEAVGGLMHPPEGATPNWAIYVTVDDVDAVAEKIPTLGGKILVQPSDVPNIGRFCVFQDPHGAVINMMTYIADYNPD